jgi:hypothetical protein
MTKLKTISAPTDREVEQRSRRDFLEKLLMGGAATAVLAACGGKGGGPTGPSGPLPGTKIKQPMIYKNSNGQELYATELEVEAGTAITVKLSDLPANKQSLVHPGYCALRNEANLIMASANGSARFIADGMTKLFYGMNMTNNAPYKPQKGSKLDSYLNYVMPHGYDVAVRLLKSGESFPDRGVNVVSGESVFLKTAIDRIGAAVNPVGMKIAWNQNDASAQIAGG